ncbi:MAG: DUF4091 domain-containing protein [Oscillospiraceae bacterium]
MSNFTTFSAVSSLKKVFPNSELNNINFDKFSMLRNEKYSFQIAFKAKKGEILTFKINSEISKYINAYYVKLIPCTTAAPKNADDYFITKNTCDFPDLLLPIENFSVKALYDGYNSIWFEIKSESQLPSGVHNISIDFFENENPIETISISADVINECLPKQDLVFTNWFHTDCIMSHYNLEVFSDEYWRIVENFLKRAREYGMTCVLTPLFTPPLDTAIGGERPTVQLVKVKVLRKNSYEFNFDNLDKWLEMCDRCNIDYYEMSHLFTQWGAHHAPKIIATVDGNEKQIFGWKTRANGRKYKAFLSQFASELVKYIDNKGIRNKCFFHVSDEPSKSLIGSYKKASKIIHENFKDFKIIDALSDFEIYEKGLIETPVPSNDHISPFIGNVKELWTYYCCCQAENYVSNRFFAMPSQRNRVLGYQLYKFDVKGFLHWGFNFWYSQYSKKVINPFEVTDAGGAFSSGDSFVVYPKEDGTPLNSLRLNVFYDGFQDMMALKLLESKIGKKKTLDLLEDGLDTPITFNNYPHSDEWQISKREQINAEIKKLI